MSKEKSIEKIERYFEWVNNESPIHAPQEVLNALHELKQPPTLADFLGWEEGQEYEYRSGDVLMLENGKIYYKSEGCSSGWCNYAISGNEIEDLRQAKKVEPKPKAWRVKDGYSFNCLMEELDRGFTFVHSKKNYIYEKNSGVRKYYYWTDDFENIKDTHEVIDYHKEEPRYYAKIKGWENIEYRPHYWIKADIRNLWDKKLRKYINSNLDTSFPAFKEAYTKEEWAKLGITDENACFEEVE